jgi:AcrR family transcriptional regulator
MRNRKATETKILDAAEEILLQQNFAALGVNAIAAKAGVGKPLVYRYFGSVDEIGQQLLDRLTPQIIEKQQQIANKLPNGNKIQTELITLGRVLMSFPVLKALLVWELAGGPVSVLSNSAFKELDGDQSNVGLENSSSLPSLMKAAISYLVLVADKQDEWDGLPLDRPNDLAKLEQQMIGFVKTFNK